MDDPLSRLPLECLHYIITFLQTKGGTPPLATLLRTNKYLASVILPYLYTNPFQLTVTDDTLRWMFNRVHYMATPANSVVLTKMLLARLYPNSSDLPTIVSLSYRLLGSNPHEQQHGTFTPSSLCSPLDYFAHIRHLDHFALIIEKPIGIFIDDSYMETDEYKSLCSIDRILPWCLSDFDPEVVNYWPVLRREVTWAIARPILEQLRSLVVFVSDIRRFLGVVDRLVNLEKVRFSLDEVLDYGEEYEEEDNMTEELINTAQKHKAESMRAVVEFVREHTRLFKDRLRSIDFIEGVNPTLPQQRCPVEIEMEIAALLPALEGPLRIHDRNWVQFLVDLPRMDLSTVERFDFPGGPQSWYERLCRHKPFYQRCRSLKKLSMISLGPGTFKWAVEERQSMDRLLGCANNAAAADRNHRQQGRGATSTDSSEAYILEYGVVPLATVWISEYKTPFADEIDDIAIGFSQTLTNFEIAAVQGLALHLPRIMHIGHGWVDLPALTILTINAEDARLILDRRLLTHCPNLICATFKDQTAEYRCQDITTCLSANLAHAENISMEGWSALTFHPATFDTTKKLKYLLMTSGSSFARSFIPPPEELEHSFGIRNNNYNPTAGPSTIPPIIQPRWSWDWHLPMLTTINFSSEFAFRFQFRMLRGCPALDSLHLDINTTNDIRVPHYRTIINADLFTLPPSSSPSPLDSSAPKPVPERIVATNLKKLSLSGCWIISDDVILAEFLAGMFPNLETFIGRTEGGFRFESMLNLIRVSSSPTHSSSASDVVVGSYGADVVGGGSGGSGGSSNGSTELLRWSPMKLTLLVVGDRFPEIRETMDRWGLYPRGFNTQYREKFDGLDVLPIRIVFPLYNCFVLRDPIVGNKVQKTIV
ncbi:MAG: hypothetical protein J3R72DRAFT_499072 [Linnemannia gamsii]|nr:MAG: hypothetical protein J3R72DRAFT_499072 [Linnemannia gamsii]